MPTSQDICMTWGKHVYLSGNRIMYDVYFYSFSLSTLTELYTFGSFMVRFLIKTPKEKEKFNWHLSDVCPFGKNRPTDKQKIQNRRGWDKSSRDQLVWGALWDGVGGNSRVSHLPGLSTTNSHKPYSPFHNLRMKNGVVDIEPTDRKQVKSISSVVYHLPARNTSFKTYQEKAWPREL